MKIEFVCSVLDCSKQAKVIGMCRDHAVKDLETRRRFESLEESETPKGITERVCGRCFRKATEVKRYNYKQGKCLACIHILYKQKKRAEAKQERKRI